MYIITFLGKANSKGNDQLIDKREWLEVTSFFGEILDKVKILFRYVVRAWFNLKREFKPILDVLSGLFIFDFAYDFFKCKNVENFLEKGLIGNFEQLAKAGLLQKNVCVNDERYFVLALGRLGSYQGWLVLVLE